MATELSRVFVPFANVRKSIEQGPDGKDREVRMVKGLVTDESLDLDGQKVDYDYGKDATAKWFKSWANIREQHSSNAIGKGVYLTALDDQRAIELTGRVIDPLAIVKIDEEILQGWSVGIKGARVVKDAKAPNGRIVGGEIVEVSLVDHPANENCKVVLAKAAKSGRLEPVVQALIEKGNPPGAMVESPLVDSLVANIEGGLNEHRTAPAGKQTALPPDTAGDELDTQPGSALRRKKKPTPEIGGTQAGLAAREKPKGAGIDKGYTPDSHGHLHTHNAGTDQEYEHDHGHDHFAGLHADGKAADHQHDHWSKAAGAETTKDSIIGGQALPGQSAGEGGAEDVTSPSGASAGVCGNGSCSCGDCGPACTGSCCEDCTMGANTSSDRVNQQADEAQRYWKYVESDIYKRDFSAADRKRMAAAGTAMPDGSFPIGNEQDLHNAIRAIGRAKNAAAAKKHIKARAAAMGMTDALPDGWKDAIPTTTKSNSEEELEDMYAKAAPQIKALLEAGDAKAALALFEAAELLAKRSIIDDQPNDDVVDDGDVAETTPDSAKPRKRVRPEGGGAGSANRAPNAETITPTKAGEPTSTKAVESELSKAVSTALKPLMDKIEALEKRAAPGGAVLHRIGAPPEVKAEKIKASLAEIRKAAEEHPDFQVREGARQLLAQMAESE